MRFFKPNYLFLFIFLILLPLAVYAQVNLEDPMDWGALGVNVGIIGAIIALTQIVKGFIPAKFVVWVPIVLAVAAYFATGAVEGHPEYALYWAAAAAYMWKVANVVTGSKALFKSKE